MKKLLLLFAFLISGISFGQISIHPLPVRLDAVQETVEIDSVLVWDKSTRQIMSVKFTDLKNKIQSEISGGQILSAESPISIVNDTIKINDSNYKKFSEIVTLGENVNAGELISPHTDGLWYKVSSTDAYAKGERILVAYNNGSANQDIQANNIGSFRCFSCTYSQGDLLYLSETPGQWSVTPPTNGVVRIVGSVQADEENWFPEDVFYLIEPQYGYVSPDGSEVNGVPISSGGVVTETDPVWTAARDSVPRLQIANTFTNTNYFHNYVQIGGNTYNGLLIVTNTDFSKRIHLNTSTGIGNYTEISVEPNLSINTSKTTFSGDIEVNGTNQSIFKGGIKSNSSVDVEGYLTIKPYISPVNNVPYDTNFIHYDRDGDVLFQSGRDGISKHYLLLPTNELHIGGSVTSNNSSSFIDNEPKAVITKSYLDNQLSPYQFKPLQYTITNSSLIDNKFQVSVNANGYEYYIDTSENTFIELDTLSKYPNNFRVKIYSNDDIMFRPFWKESAGGHFVSKKGHYSSTSVEVIKNNNGQWIMTGLNAINNLCFDGSFNNPSVYAWSTSGDWTIDNVNQYATISGIAGNGYLADNINFLQGKRYYIYIKATVIQGSIEIWLAKTTLAIDPNVDTKVWTFSSDFNSKIVTNTLTDSYPMFIINAVNFEGTVDNIVVYEYE